MQPDTVTDASTPLVTAQLAQWISQLKREHIPAGVVAAQMNALQVIAWVNGLDELDSMGDLTALLRGR